jgi:hypothetical protein
VHALPVLTQMEAARGTDLAKIGALPHADESNTARLMARLQANNSVLNETAAKPKLSELAPGQASNTTLREGSHTVPNIVWPASPAEAKASLAANGFTVKATDGLSTLFTKGESHVTLTEMKVSGLEGYTVGAHDTQHVQLGQFTFEPSEWQLLQSAYTQTIKSYNAIVDRPAVFERSPLPRDGSALHGPQDGLKHFLLLGAPLEELEVLRADQQELVELTGSIRTLIAEARAAGTLPKKVMLMVEGRDGASKTGNGLAIARVFESEGYTVRVKAFRAPTAEERAQGLMGRHRDHAQLDAPSEAYEFILSDRTFAGDYTHNPDAVLQDVVDAVHAFEHEARAKGVMVSKMLFDPGDEAPIVTFGKRLARAAIAEDLLERRANLSDEEKASLRKAATLKPGLGDFQSISRAERDTLRNNEFADANELVFPWSRIRTSDRHVGRKNSRTAFSETWHEHQAQLRERAKARPTASSSAPIK